MKDKTRIEKASSDKLCLIVKLNITLDHQSLTRARDARSKQTAKVINDIPVPEPEVILDAWMSLRRADDNFAFFARSLHDHLHKQAVDENQQIEHNRLQVGGTSIS